MQKIINGERKDVVEHEPKTIGESREGEKYLLVSAKRIERRDRHSGASVKKKKGGRMIGGNGRKEIAAHIGVELSGGKIISGRECKTKTNNANKGTTRQKRQLLSPCVSICV